MSRQTTLTEPAAGICARGATGTHSCRVLLRRSASKRSLHVSPKLVFRVGVFVGFSTCMRAGLHRDQPLGLDHEVQVQSVDSTELLLDARRYPARGAAGLWSAPLAPCATTSCAPFGRAMPNS
jgi:hypothetical protein